MDLVRGNEGERCALNIVLPPSIDLDQDLGRGEMGRASGQRQLCHAHTHRPERYPGTFRNESHTHTLTYLLVLTTHAHTHGPERYLGTFRTSYSYSYLSIPHHSCSYSRYLGTFLPRLYFCKCSIVFSYPCSEILMNLNLQQCSADESSSPKHNDKFRLTVVNHLHVECMAKLCEVNPSKINFSSNPTI